jgi:NAD(P)-dependent dehydrogenase (short-subunit alcohol dehydrogenase family)
MLLENKIAIVYGAAGNVGRTVARTFAREGARVVLAGRTAETLKTVAEQIRADGGHAETAVVDASDRKAVDDHLDAVIGEYGRIDISLNATSLHGEKQGTPLRRMDVEDFSLPTRTALVSNFHTATAAANRMSAGGVLITLSTSAAALSGRDRRFHRTGGFGVACASVEEFTRSLAGEVGPDGIRVVCLRPDALPETWGSGIELDIEITQSEAYAYMSAGTALDRMPKLQEVADTAAFAASGRGGAITGAVINLSCGSVMA